MTDPEEATAGPDDTAAFQRFYGAGAGDVAGADVERGLLYRLFVGWWRDRR